MEKNAVNFLAINIPKWYSSECEGGLVSSISFIMKEHVFIEYLLYI